MNPEVYTHRLKVPESAIDSRHHVNNLSYLQWCLEAAQNHWERNSSDELRNAVVWYVLHHSIDYKAAAFEGEELQIETWVAWSEGVKSERRYRIIRVEEQKTLVEAKTIWCLLDAKSLKPTKITEEIRTLFQKN